VFSVLARSNEVDRSTGPIMTHASQTQPEAGELRSSSFASLNRLVNIAFWNVITMFQTSKAAQVAKKFREYRLDIRLFGAIIKSNLLYGCECWTLTKKLEKRLQVFQQRCMRRILRVFYPNLVTNREILRRAGQIDVMEEITDRKWR
jgi:hypothetical protein